MDKNISRKRRTKSGEAAPPPPPNNNKNKKYNLRNKTVEESEIRWVDDDTLFEEEDEDDETYYPEDDESDDDMELFMSKTVPTKDLHGITFPKDVPVSVKIHIHRNSIEDEEPEKTKEEEEEEDNLTEDDIARLLARTLGSTYGTNRRESEPAFFIIEDSTPSQKPQKSKGLKEKPAIFMSKKETEYFEELPKSQCKKLLKIMKNVEHHIGETIIPFKFRVLELDTSDEIKASLIRKIDTITRMGPESGESQKLRVWIESILRVPFGKYIPLPVTLKDGPVQCSEYVKKSIQILDNATYGMEPAKMQIMQTLAQWVSNPESLGNCIAMQGPAGVGKTSFAKNGIAKVLERPFMFFSLGGASDIAHYTGHSYTYEGSTWGRIIDSIIQSKVMNPVLYFDELDKISGTPHGEEITSMLIHLTDRTQNSQYHDRYFAGIDFDLSKCLFVFSYNDEHKINPILKDRMTVIQCSGYKDAEKKIIIANYVWPDILQAAGINKEDLTASEEAAEYIIKHYSNNEQGMRSLIRVVETIVSRINLLRISDAETNEKYKFNIPIKFPMKLEVPTILKLLIDYAPKEPESWRSLYN